MPVSDPFSLQHLPYGLVDFPHSGEKSAEPDLPNLCVRYGDFAVSLGRLSEHPRAPLESLDLPRTALYGSTLNPFIALPRETHLAVRALLQKLLKEGIEALPSEAYRPLAPYPADDPAVHCPVAAGDFVDFYCSRHHALRVGTLFRGPENALPQQYFHLPIGYHGRSSTIAVSGGTVPRPRGILPDSGAPSPHFGPTRRLDYELEVGFLLRPWSPGTDLLLPEQAHRLFFGAVLLNDWSARDIQSYEYRPLGPFLGKSFATTVGAWVTPMEALEPYRCPNLDSDHPVLPHLRETSPHHFKLPLWAELETDGATTALCRTDLRHLAWSPAQMLTHLCSNGTAIRAGDLIATGTVSGPEPGSEACLLERTVNGAKPLELSASGAHRTYFEDGDSVALYGGLSGVGLAPARATVTPSTLADPEELV